LIIFELLERPREPPPELGQAKSISNMRIVMWC